MKQLPFQLCIDAKVGSIWRLRKCPLKPEVLLRKVPQVQIRMKADVPLTQERDEPRKRTRKPISLQREEQGHPKGQDYTEKSHNSERGSSNASFSRAN